MGKYSFNTAADLRKEILRKYPRGTGRENVEKIEGVERYGDRLCMKLAAAPAGTRHYVDRDGRSRSKQLKQSWNVVFEFENDTRLKDVEVTLVSEKD